MDEITKALTTFSSWAVSLTAIFGLLATLCKPLRERLQKKIVNKNSCMMKAVTEIKNDVEGIQKDVSGLKSDVRELSEKHKELVSKNDANERDRLRETIFRFGNYARKGSKITSEEFRHLQEVFTKYQSLGGNGIAKAEFEFIREYYNSNAGKWI